MTKINRRPGTQPLLPVPDPPSDARDWSLVYWRGEWRAAHPLQLPCRWDGKKWVTISPWDGTDGTTKNKRHARKKQARRPQSDQGPDRRA